MQQRTWFSVPADAIEDLEYILTKTRSKNVGHAVRLALYAYNSMLYFAAQNASIRVIDFAGSEAPYSPHLQFRLTQSEVAISSAERNSNKCRQLSLCFKDNTPEVIEEIRRRNLFTNNSEPLRVALKLFAELVAHVEKGSRFVVDIGSERFAFDPFAPVHASMAPAVKHDPIRPARDVATRLSSSTRSHATCDKR